MIRYTLSSSKKLYRNETISFISIVFFIYPPKGDMQKIEIFNKYFNKTINITNTLNNLINLKRKQT